MLKSISFSLLASAIIFTASPSFAGGHTNGKAPSQVVEYGSGWYLRGDIGFNSGGKLESGFSEFQQNGTNSTFDYDGAYGLSVGFGKRVNSYFRWDVNAESLLDGRSDTTEQAVFRGLDNSLPAYVDVAGTRRTEFNYEAVNFMFNGYVDLGRYYGITPYIGAGVGLALLETGMTITETCSPGADVQCIDPAGAQGTEAVGVPLDETSEEWVMSYGFNAGFSVDIAKNTQFDLGYQYLNVGGGPIFNYDDDGDFDGFQLHRIKAGVRFDLW